MSETAEAEVADELHDAEAVPCALAEYNPTAAGLADLRARLKGVVYDLATVKGNAAARADRKELVSLRTSLEAKRRELKAPALERSRLIDAEAKRIEGEILALERPIDAAIKADEERREAERKAKAEAEARAAARIAEVLDGIRAVPVKASHKGSIVIESLIEDLVALQIPSEVGDAGEQLRTRVLEQLRGMHAEALAAEAEARRLREERAQLERERAEQAEKDRIEQEERHAQQVATEKAAAEQRARLAALADEEIAQRRAALEREEQQRREALDREREALDQQRIEQEQVAAQRERERQAVIAAQNAAAEAQREKDRIAAEALKAAEALERDWLDAIAEDERRAALLEAQAAAAEAEKERQAAMVAARERDAARHQARADAIELVNDLAAMSAKPPIKSVWLEIWARAVSITGALAEGATE